MSERLEVGDCILMLYLVLLIAPSTQLKVQYAGETLVKE